MSAPTTDEKRELVLLFTAQRKLENRVIAKISGSTSTTPSHATPSVICYASFESRLAVAQQSG